MNESYSEIIRYIINTGMMTREQTMQLKSRDLRVISNSRAYASWKLNEALKRLVLSVKNEFIKRGLM